MLMQLLSVPCSSPGCWVAWRCCAWAQWCRAEGLRISPFPAVFFFFQVPRCVHHNTSSHQIAEKDTRKSFGRRSRGTQHLLQALIQPPLAPAAFPGQNSPCAWPGGEKKSE